jgi:hypothetical protein
MRLSPGKFMSMPPVNFETTYNLLMLVHWLQLCDMREWTFNINRTSLTGIRRIT